MSNRVNIPVVSVVAAVCGAALILFFLFYEKPQNGTVLNGSALTDAPEYPAGAPDSESVSEVDYYNRIADEYLSTLPADKTVVARLVDDTNHRIYYIEKSNTPSCYVLDLDKQTTTVLFGGEQGFYCGTKLLIIGTIRSWKRVGSIIYFVADNRAPETDYSTATVVFFANLHTHELQYLDKGADAYFPDDNHLVLNRAILLYPGIFSGENIYSKVPVTYEL